MVALLATKPLLIAGLCVVALVPAGAARGDPQPRRAGRRRPGHDRLPRARGALGPGLGLVLLALAPAAAVLVDRDARRARTRCCARSAARCWRPRAAPSGPVRELLAESLGDRSVAIAYWLPDREAFVDEAGHPVALPEPGSGRAWTAVEQDGRRVAAIVHDAALDTSPELVEAAAAASSLAIDNERLKADLRARVEDLRVSRLRIVEAADEARRRIERDLHDGAQQQLLALALELRVLRASISRSRGRTARRRARGAPRGRAERAARARPRHPSGDPHRAAAWTRDRLAGRPLAGPGRRARARSTAAWRRRSRRPPTSSWPRR